MSALSHKTITSTLRVLSVAGGMVAASGAAFAFDGPLGKAGGYGGLKPGGFHKPIPSPGPHLGKPIKVHPIGYPKPIKVPPIAKPMPLPGGPVVGSPVYPSRPNYGGVVAAGLIGGLALGAMAAATPTYVEEAECYTVRRRFTDAWGTVYIRRVQVCE